MTPPDHRQGRLAAELHFDGPGCVCTDAALSVIHATPKERIGMLNNMGQQYDVQRLWRALELDLATNQPGARP